MSFFTQIALLKMNRADAMVGLYYGLLMASGLLASRADAIGSNAGENKGFPSEQASSVDYII